MRRWLPTFRHASAFYDERIWISGGQTAGWFSTYAVSGEAWTNTGIARGARARAGLSRETFQDVSGKDIWNAHTGIETPGVCSLMGGRCGGVSRDSAVSSDLGALVRQ